MRLGSRGQKHVFWRHFGLVLEENGKKWSFLESCVRYRRSHKVCDTSIDVFLHKLVVFIIGGYFEARFESLGGKTRVFDYGV